MSKETMREGYNKHFMDKVWGVCPDHPRDWINWQAACRWQKEQDSNFVKGLYFDDTFQDGTLTGESIFSLIAEAIRNQGK